MYLKAPNPADVNRDGMVNILDLLQVANNLGEAIPDPNGDGAGQCAGFGLYRPAV